MSTLESTISAAILPELEGFTTHEKWLNCAIEYPWYPLSWLMLAKQNEKEFLQKANLFFTDEQRLHWLLNIDSWQEDEWLNKNLPIALENGFFSTEDEEVIRINEGKNEEVLRYITAEEGTANKVLPGEKDHELTENNPREATPNEPLENKGVVNYDSSEALNETLLTDGTNDLAKKHITEPGAIEKNVVEKPLIMREPSLIQSESGPLAFEPFHSVDYFASQGIKLDLTAEPKDKFDRQLKSFTQWLKTMKKVTVQEPATSADPVVDAQANQSNSGEEIITEAMALVLEKQGKFEKAVNIYQKLMLLHPEKSVFFAAQIEDLKNKR